MLLNHEFSLWFCFRIVLFYFCFCFCGWAKQVVYWARRDSEARERAERFDYRKHGNHVSVDLILCSKLPWITEYYGSRTHLPITKPDRKGREETEKRTTRSCSTLLTNDRHLVRGCRPSRSFCWSVLRPMEFGRSASSFATFAISSAHRADAGYLVSVPCTLLIVIKLAFPRPMHQVGVLMSHAAHSSTFIISYAQED